VDSGAMQSIKKFLGLGEAKPKKEQVDPYVLASYAGREARSKTLYGTDSPVFNQKLNLGFLFPSVSDQIKFVVKDWYAKEIEKQISTHCYLRYLSLQGSING
jgi:hypothetical protein